MKKLKALPDFLIVNIFFQKTQDELDAISGKNKRVTNELDDPEYYTRLNIAVPQELLDRLGSEKIKVLNNIEEFRKGHKLGAKMIDPMMILETNPHIFPELTVMWMKTGSCIVLDVPFEKLNARLKEMGYIIETI